MIRFSTDVLGCLTCSSLIIFIISTIIGIPCVIYGCNASYTQCLKYDFVDKTVIKTGGQQIDTTICTAYVTINKVTTCSAFMPYTYFVTNVYFDTCIYTYDGEFKTMASAMTYGLATFPSGLTMQMAVSKEKPTVCELQGGLVKNLAIVGFVFTPIAGLSALIFLCSYCIYKIQSVKDEQTLPRQNGGARRHLRPILV